MQPTLGGYPVMTMGLLSKRKVVRYNQIRAKLLGTKEDDKALDVDVRNYAKYMLKEGTMIEKHELLGCLKNRIVLKDKKIALKK